MMTTRCRSMSDDDRTGGRRVVRRARSASAQGTPVTASPLEQRPLVTDRGEALVIGPLAAGQSDALFGLLATSWPAPAIPTLPPLTRGVFDHLGDVGDAGPHGGSGRRGRRRLLPEAQISGPGRPHRQRRLRGGRRPPSDRGIGRLLLEDSLARAPLLGFDAIGDPNVVFAGNPARSLYEELGWRAIGRLPEAVDGEDAIIYWRHVGEADRVDGRCPWPVSDPDGQSPGRLRDDAVMADGGHLATHDSRTIHQAGSISPLARARRADVVAAWWLLCSPHRPRSRPTTGCWWPGCHTGDGPSGDLRR